MRIIDAENMEDLKKLHKQKKQYKNSKINKKMRFKFSKEQRCLDEFKKRGLDEDLAHENINKFQKPQV